ncbi:MAG TPA: rhomboid family intramembrane serine protease [Kofleriaceae bacterium]|nr:rhomboid family intramembrane serine protease [Kofleriaceae bacterium]
MIVPVGIEHTIRGLPRVTIGIIALCTLVQIYSDVWAPSLEQIRQHVEEKLSETMIDDKATGDVDIDTQKAEQIAQELKDYANKNPIVHFGYPTGYGLTWRVFTSAFVHAGWLHLIGNMIFLWLVGAALEDRWGPMKFALFWLAGSAASALAYDFVTSGEGLLVGASGAVSALMGAFLVYFAKMQIRLFYWFGFRAGTFLVAAYVALPVWLGEQLLEHWLQSQSMTHVDSTAYSAHIGGFAFGFAVALVARMIGGRDEPYDAPDPEPAAGEVPVAVARQVPRAATDKPLPRALREQVQKCMDAIGKRDASAVRTAASRTIIDLDRAGDRARVLEIYRAIATQLATMPLTDGALAAAAEAARVLDRGDDYVAIAAALAREHPYSLKRPKVMWDLAQIHRAAGRTDEATATLKELAARFPRDEYGQKARGQL